MNSDDAKAMVLAEYRRLRRNRWRPYPAMDRIQDDAACAYCYGVIAELPADAAVQVRALARFRAADAYGRQIVARYKKPPKPQGFWLHGVTRERVSS